MKSSTKQLKESPRPPAPPDLSSALQVQELRSFIEREKAKPQSASRFKDSEPISRPTSARQSTPKQAPKPLAESSEGEESEVALFLRELGLERYTKVFEQEGVRGLGVAAEMSEERLAAMGVALGHRIKILKRLREVVSKEPADPAPAFKIAVEEVKKPPRDLRKPLVKKAESRPLPAGVSSGLESNLTTNERECCWECYRTFFRDVGEVLDSKTFCSSHCLQKYRKTACVVCPCGAEQLKSLCIMSEAQYYCNSKCIPSGDRETTADSQPASVEESSAGEFSVTSKILQKYAGKGQATIKEANFEGTQPRLPVMDLAGDMKGWEASIDASFDFERAEDSPAI